MTRRQEQMSAVLREAVQEVIGRGFSDPRISGMITVTSVRLAPDFSHAAVMVSVLPEDRQTLTLHGLKAAVGHIRREVGKLVRNRKLPQLSIDLDTSFKTQAKVLGALDKARSEVRESGWGQAGGVEESH